MYLILGIIMLYLGAEWFVRGASGLSIILKVTPLMIGIAVVSAGTSAPELIVSSMAALRGSSDIAMGNIVGSNIANIALVLGVTSLIFPTTIKREIIRRELTLMIIFSIIFYLFAINGTIGRIEGGVLLTLMLLFILLSYGAARKEHAKIELEERIEKATLGSSLFWLALGCPALFIGSHLIVTAGTTIARSFGVSEIIIGISLVAVGTSIPEMATSVMAAFRKNFDICVGNVIGSNIFNLLLVIGVVALIKPLNVSQDIIQIHLPIMLLFSFVLVPIMRIKYTISRLDGLLLLAGYFIFIGYIYF